MNTFILFWNPEISSYRPYDFSHDCLMMTKRLNWSVWEHEKVQVGDRYYMVCCGKGNTGLCMSGVIMSLPYQAEDWSGRGRTVYYVDIEPDVMIDPTVHALLSTDKLLESLPGFDWTGGHSGRLLDEANARKLNSIWHAFLRGSSFIDHHAWWRDREDHADDYGDRFMPDDAEGLISVNPDGTFCICEMDTCMDIEVEGYTSLDEAKHEFEQEMIDAGFDGTIEYTFESIIDSDNEELYLKALTLAQEKHRVQVDKNGKPYIGHVLRVSEQCTGNDHEVITGLLHDLIEDTDVTAQSLRDEGFPDKIVEAVQALTRREGEPYEDFIKRAALNPIARHVKLADLEDNLDVKRLDHVDTAAAQRLDRYVKAWHYLNDLICQEEDDEESDD